MRHYDADAPLEREATQPCPATGRRRARKVAADADIQRSHGTSALGNPHTKREGTHRAGPGASGCRTAGYRAAMLSALPGSARDPRTKETFGRRASGGGPPAIPTGASRF